MIYTQKNLYIKIYIAKTDIDIDDRVKLYETTDDPSNPDLLATILPVETSNDPSFGDSYLFNYTKRVNLPITYSFYYTVVDTAGNESDSVSSFSYEVCLYPVTPNALSGPFYDSTEKTLTFNL